MEPEASTSKPLVVPMAASKNGRTPGKAHKSQKTAKARSYISPAIKTPFEKRREADKKREATKGVEREMKEEKESEKERYVHCSLFMPSLGSCVDTQEAKRHEREEREG